MVPCETTKVILPTAPRKPVSCNNGYVMTSWFDIFSIGENEDESPNYDGLKDPEILKKARSEYSQKDLIESSDFLIKLIEKEAEEVRSTKNVFIGGFSQGAILSLATFLRYDKSLGGVVGLSGI